jgi:hypothetical protein
MSCRRGSQKAAQLPTCVDRVFGPAVAYVTVARELLLSTGLLEKSNGTHARGVGGGGASG